MGFRFAVRFSERTTPTGDGKREPVETRGSAVVKPPKARSYGMRTTAQYPPAGNSPASRTPLPLRGSQPDEISNPRSVEIADGDSFNPGRSFMGRTEDGLNTGPIPARIDRGTTARDRGKIATGAGPEGVTGWPYDGNGMFIPHVVIPRRPITVTDFARTIDTSVAIVAPAIGGPVS